MDEEGVSGGVGGYCGRGGGGNKCGRWNPTAEQVKVLTELFRSGLRTPTTEQIQKISSHLSSFGKIESKNVFYWFQNHKARERHHHHHHHNNTIKKRRREPPPEVDKRDAFAAAVARSAINTSAFVGCTERERDMETLELFPLSSYEEPVRIVRSSCERKDGPPAFSAGWDPPLDLRLSYF